jgi:hypothetical protein
MHVALYVTDPILASRIRDLPGAAEIHATGNHVVFERLAGRADILVIGFERLDEPGALELVRDTRTRHRDKPLLLVTSDERENAAHLVRLEADGVVWLHELEGRLPERIDQLGRLALRRRLAAAVEASARLSRPLRKALSAALLADFPPRRVADLARLGEAKPRAFAEHWKRDVRDATGLTPREFLRLLLLLRLFELRGAGDAWARAARALGVEPSYAERIAQLELGEPLGRLKALDAGDVGEWILKRLGTAAR